MDIVFSSDLHVDHPQLKIEWPSADVCVVGGDIANDIGTVLKTLRKLSARYRDVVFIAGNHEHYSNSPKKVSRRRTVQETETAIRWQLPANVHFLTHDHPRVDIGGLHFIGMTGWYTCDLDEPGREINAEEMYAFMDKMLFNDARNVGFTPRGSEHPWDLGRRDAAIMRQQIMAIDDDLPIVVVTHMPPRSDWVRWTGVEAKDATNLFYVNTSMSRVIDDLGDRISLWYCGHVHHCKEVRIGRMIGLLNPRGYPGQNGHWEPVVVSSSEL